MTLSPTHPKIIQFLQALSQQPRLLSYREIAKTIKVDGERVSVKTVQHWMNVLRGPSPETKPQFFYYPSFSYEAMGLRQSHVWGDLPVSLIPWTSYSVVLHDFKKAQRLNTLLLPNIMSKLVQFGSGKTLYNFDGSAPAMDYEHSFKNHFDKYESFQFQQSSMRKHPLIVPCIFEYQHRASNAQNVWRRIKERLGKDIHLYAPRVHTEKQGVYAVRETLRALTPLIVEVHIDYLPLFSQKSVYYAFTDRLCLNELYAYVVMVRVYKTNKGYLHIVVADQGALENILPLLEGAGIQSFHRILQQPTQKILTNSSFTMIDYAKVYNSKNASWKVPELRRI